MNAIEYLKAVAVVEACRGGLEYVVQHSSISEAVYVKVRRGEAWYGIRIAAHPPFYASSLDHQQILVPARVDDTEDLAAAEAELAEAIRGGGLVVADPDEVGEALLAALRAKRDGVTVRSGENTVWRWDESRLAWRLVRVDGREATAEDGDRYQAQHPGNAPAARLSSPEQSAIRHRLNLRARWALEEAARFAMS